MGAKIEETSQKAKNVEDIVKALRQETTNSKVLNAMCHVFALRERARDRITVGSLRQTMYKEGFSFTMQEFEKALKFMASIGIGKLHYDRSGKVQALKEIKITLQSIGKAAVAKQDTLETYASPKKFINIPAAGVTQNRFKTDTEAPHTVEELTDTPVRMQDQAASYAATLSVNIEGKVVSFPLPPITPQELGEILSQGYAKKF